VTILVVLLLTVHAVMQAVNSLAKPHMLVRQISVTINQDIEIKTSSVTALNAKATTMITIM